MKHRAAMIRIKRLIDSGGYEVLEELPIQKADRRTLHRFREGLQRYMDYVLGRGSRT